MLASIIPLKHDREEVEGARDMEERPHMGLDWEEGG